MIIYYVPLMFCTALAKIITFLGQAYIKGIFYFPYIIITLGAASTLIFIFYLIYKKARSVKKIKYDYKYLLQQARGNNKRSAATTVQGLARRFVVQGPTTTRVPIVGDRSALVDIINQNIFPIQKFIQAEPSIDKTLIIEGEWGSGKTTNVLIAINEWAQKNKDKSDSKVDRTLFIYKAAFEYADEIMEFKKEILYNLRDILYQEGYQDCLEDVNKILRNITGVSYAGIGLKFRNKTQADLTQDNIHNINQKISKHNDPKQIVIILDDIDRLVGKNVVETISFLSILTKLDIVKVLVPMDTQAVVKQLREIGLYKPEAFLEKYLPISSSVRIKSGYERIEELGLVQIRYLLRNVGESPIPLIMRHVIWHIVLLRLFTDRLETCYGTVDTPLKGSWLKPEQTSALESEVERAINSCSPEYRQSLKILLSAPQDIKRHNLFKNDNCCSNQGRSPEWDDLERANVKFYKVIYNMSIVKTGLFDKEDDKIILKQSFDEKIYRQLIEGWLRSFAKEHWNELGIPLRTVLDTIEKVVSEQNLEGAPTRDMLGLFKHLFNRMFDADLQ